MVCVFDVIGIIPSRMFPFQFCTFTFRLGVCDMFVLSTLIFTFLSPILDIPLHTLQVNRLCHYNIAQLSVLLRFLHLTVLTLQTTIGTVIVTILTGKTLDSAVMTTRAEKYH
jgi:hypothetical protein